MARGSATTPHNNSLPLVASGCSSCGLPRPRGILRSCYHFVDIDYTFLRPSSKCFFDGAVLQEQSSRAFIFPNFVQGLAYFALGLPDIFASGRINSFDYYNSHWIKPSRVTTLSSDG